MAAAALVGGGAGSLGRLAAQQRLTQEDLLKFDAMGQVTIVHVTDLHAQFMPQHYREPSINLGVGESKGMAPHVSGEAFLKAYGIPAGSPMAYALTDQDFAGLAKTYGRMGGFDRVATVIKAIRAERGEHVLLLDGGDTWTNSWTSLQTKAADVVDAMNLLKPDAMTGHWEFTLGAERVKEITDKLAFPFLAQNMRDTEFEDIVFEPKKIFEKGGLKIAVIGQAYPYTAISNPRWMFPKWQFGLREDELQKQVDDVRANGGADCVVLLSHNGFDIDRKMAGRVRGIDVILTAHTHDALPEAVKVGKTLVIASGCNGKFVSRLDLDIRDREVKGYRYRLIPVFSDSIAPDAEMAALVKKHRAPFEADLGKVLGKTNGTLYRRGNFQGSLDDVFCDSMLAVRDAEIALSPGVRWGTSLLPGQDITFEDVTNACAISYPNCYRLPMTGARLKEVLEDVADNIFNPDPYLQGGGDMVRVGGLGFTVDVSKPINSRISNLTVLKDGKPLDASREYIVAGWASINEGTQGPPIWDVVSQHLAAKKVVEPRPLDAVKVVGI
jgi:S-sulfosulfanyl-L-cysteine sulfohydrolase